MRVIAIVALVLLLPKAGIGQRLAGWIDSNQRIVLQPLAGKSMTLRGADLKSESGMLIPADVADPFRFLLSNTAQQVTLGNVVDPVTLDGSTILDVGYDVAAALEEGSDPCSDIQLGLSGSAYAEPFCTIPGDADFSGIVDFADFLILSNRFSDSETEWPSGDFDWDRRTGFSDFLLLSEHFGDASPAYIFRDGENASVRVSTQVEIDYLGGEFVADPNSPPAYWVDREQLWARWPEQVAANIPLTDSAPITITAPSIDYARSTHFGVEWTRTGDRIQIASVRLKDPVQTTEFRIIEDLDKALVLPIGTLTPGDFVVDVNSYEIIDAIGVDDFDVSNFLADPYNFELPEGLRRGVATATTLAFRIEPANMNPVPEPFFKPQFLAMAFAIAVRSRSRSRRIRSKTSGTHRPPFPTQTTLLRAGRLDTSIE